MTFRTSFGETIFNQKYQHRQCETWEKLADTLVEDVCGGLLSGTDKEAIKYYIKRMKFIPGGRYLYYAGRPTAFYNNCFAMKAEDTREGWAELIKNVSAALMIGGGVGVVYDLIRGSGTPLKQTGGVASGPIALMQLLNEIGRNVQQGGSRRSALWAGLNWRHPDIQEFIQLKNWSKEVRALKAKDYNFPANMDMTNISVLFDNNFIHDADSDDIFNQVVRQMCKTGEPGMCFNFKQHTTEILRNACCEFITDTDSDMCNLGSVNLSAINTITEFSEIVKYASMFLVCGSVKASLPYSKCYQVRDQNRKIGLGLMGVHEWLLQRHERYEVTDELKGWLDVYKNTSESAANECADTISISRPSRYRAIAPAGTISILAGTTSGIEPLFSVAMKRRYLVGSTQWKYQYIIDPTAEYLMERYDLDPDRIETAYKLAGDPERRIMFQADVQRYVDMGISSTINLPPWKSGLNNEDTVPKLAEVLKKYCTKLRGITTYPDGARDGQTLTEVPYSEAVGKVGKVYEDFTDQQCKSGVCGI